MEAGSADRLRRDTNFDEAVPGRGGPDHAALLTTLDRLGPDMPVMLEHLASAAEYESAAALLRAVAREVDVSL